MTTPSRTPIALLDQLASAPRAAKRCARPNGCLVLLGAAIAIFFTASCDAYECTSQPCGSETWDRCIVCATDSCTYQARSRDGDVLDECTYATSSVDETARDHCFDQTNAAGADFCADSGTPSSSGNGSNVGTSDPGCDGGSCDLCVFSGCQWCPATKACIAYTSSACSVHTIDDTAQCVNGVGSDDCTAYPANSLPPGSYFQSCHDLSITSPFHLHADCNSNGPDAVSNDFYFGNCLGQLSNDDGHLQCVHCE